MKKKILAVSFLVFIFWYGTALSKGEYQYTVQGTVETTNLSEFIQQGTITLQVYDGKKKVFDETGSLIGIVTGSDGNCIYLTHMAIFEDWSMFVTDGDIAVFTDVTQVDGEDKPCAFQASEIITKIAFGMGFFKGISDANLTGEGVVSYCDNQNEFQLSGDLWFK